MVCKLQYLQESYREDHNKWRSKVAKSKVVKCDYETNQLKLIKKLNKNCVNYIKYKKSCTKSM